MTNTETSNTTWLDDAFCRPTFSSVFQATVTDEDVLRAKVICEICPVKTECLEDAMTVELSYELHGVLGGTTVWERRQLKAASDDELRAISDLAASTTIPERISIREIFESTPPNPASLLGLDTAQVSAKFGVSDELAEQWAGSSPALKTAQVKHTNPQQEAILSALAGGDWHDRDVVREMARSTFTEDEREELAERLNSRKNGKKYTANSAAGYQVAAVLDAMLDKSRIIEQRVERENGRPVRRMLRLLPKAQDGAHA